MASVATSLLRYPDRLRIARSEDERNFIRIEHAKLIRGIFRTHEIAIAALEGNQCETSLMIVFTRLLSRFFSLFVRSTS
jgi:hypothetical protein